MHLPRLLLLQPVSYTHLDVYKRQEELYAAEKNIEAARRALKKAQENKSKSQTEAEIESVTYKAELSEKEKLRDTLKEIIDNGGHVMAPVSGTVLKTLEKGSKTEADVEDVYKRQLEELLIQESYV